MPSPTPTDLARDALAKVALLEKDVARLQEESERIDRLQLRERIAVLEDRVAVLKNGNEEHERRRWQFVYIFAGAVATLLVTVLVQLVLLPLVKK